MFRELLPNLVAPIVVYSTLARAKLKASAQHFEKGKRYAQSSQWDLAASEYQQTLLLNPGNQHAADELDRALEMIRRRDEQPSEMQRIKEQAKKDALAPPKLVNRVEAAVPSPASIDSFSRMLGRNTTPLPMGGGGLLVSAGGAASGADIEPPVPSTPPVAPASGLARPPAHPVPQTR